MALIVCCTFAASCQVPTGESEVAPSGRLPEDLRPLHYELMLRIDPEQDRFSGKVQIAIELLRPRATIWLHARDLDVASAQLRLATSDAPIVARFEESPEEGVAALRLPHAIGPGRAILELEWSAELAKGLRGLYRVEQGGDRYAFTQFEPISARAAFPCFDEPAFKTPFDVRLQTPAGAVALANTPETAKRALEDGFIERSFAPTPPLPTYLIAWAVGPLDLVEATPIAANAFRDHPLPLRGAAPRGRGSELAYALERTGPILAALEAYFASPYPFAKLDIVAVPDFAAGAMENVGLTTFRDSLLLIDPASAPVHQRRGFANVMAHELAHQWFGNLVTMPWWDDLWLNESFATWLAARTVGELYPENRSAIAQLRATHRAMGADSLVSARRIRQPIESNHDIRNAFDSITYRKGGAVLTMFEAWLGADAFKDVVQSFVDQHRFSSAGAEDFLAVLGARAGPEVAESFRGFLDQGGLPFVEVALACRDGRSVLDVEQSRFLPIGSSGGDSVQPRWLLPLCVRPGRGGEAMERECALARGGSTSLSLATDCADWLLPNAGATGYYRWSVDEPSMQELLGDGWAALSVVERMAVGDALGAAFASGHATAGSIFASLAPFARDEERAVATVPFRLIDFGRRHLARSAVERAEVEALGRQLYSERARVLGFDSRRGEDDEARLLRAALVGFAVESARDPGLREEAVERGLRYLGVEEGSAALDLEAAAPDLLSLIARSAVEDGGEVAFEAARRHFFASEEATLRARLLTALAHAREGVLAERAREFAFDPRLKESEVLSVLWVQSTEPDQREAAWNWMVARYDRLFERLGSERGAGLIGVASGGCSEAEARSVEDFFVPRIGELDGGPRRLAKALESIRLCAARAEYHRDDALRYFSEAARR